MNTEKTYTFLHKQIRNMVPGKKAQRACIEGLRRCFFPELLEDRRITLDAAILEGTAKKHSLREGYPLPASAIVRASGAVPPKLRLPAAEVPPLCVYALEDGYCFRSFVLDKSCRFLSDASHDRLWESNLYRNNKSIRAKRAQCFDAEAIALNTTYTDNYYHWFADLVGRLLCFQELDDKFICTDLRLPWQREAFELLGIDASRLISFTDYGLYRFKRLFVFGAPQIQNRYALSALRDFAAGFSPEAGAPKRLYISRNDSPGRRSIANEEDLLPLLASRGFTRVVFSDLSVARQIALLRGADYVVFPQGAAVINMAFCRPSAKFLELYSPAFEDATGPGISTSLGLVHHIVFGKCPDPAAGAHAPYSVEPRDLEEALDTLLGR